MGKGEGAVEGIENASSISSSASLKNFNISVTNQSIVRQKEANTIELNMFRNLNLKESESFPRHRSLNKVRFNKYSNKIYEFKDEGNLDSEVLSSDGNTAINEINLHTVKNIK